MSKIKIEKYSSEKYKNASLSDLDNWSRAQEPGALLELADRYFGGKVPGKSLVDAVPLYKQAVQKEYPPAQVRLGTLYEKGFVVDPALEGSAQHLAEALRLYSLAARVGYAHAYFKLGECHENGKGVPKDPTDAFMYYAIADNEGYPVDKSKLPLGHKRGSGLLSHQNMSLLLGLPGNKSNLKMGASESTGSKEQTEPDKKKKKKKNRNHSSSSEKTSAQEGNKEPPSLDKEGLVRTGAALETKLDEKTPLLAGTDLVSTPASASATVSILSEQTELVLEAPEPEFTTSDRITTTATPIAAETSFITTPFPLTNINTAVMSSDIKSEADQEIPESKISVITATVTTKTTSGKRAVPTMNATTSQHSEHVENEPTAGPPSEEIKSSLQNREGRNLQLAVERDYKKAEITELQKWGQKKDSEAQFELGERYLEARDGIAVKNYKNAVQCYQLAAKNGCTKAEWRLAMCYESGWGVKQDSQKSQRLYELAAHKGVVAAQQKIVSDNQKNGLKNPIVQHNLAIHYTLGWVDGKVDLQQAVHWVRLAAEQGIPESQYDLGQCYFSGWGVEKDDKLALYWYRLAAKKNIKDAQQRVDFLARNEEKTTESSESIVTSPATQEAATTLVENKISETDREASEALPTSDQTIIIPEIKEEPSTQGNADALLKNPSQLVEKGASNAPQAEEKPPLVSSTVIEATSAVDLTPAPSTKKSQNFEEIIVQTGVALEIKADLTKSPSVPVESIPSAIISELLTTANTTVISTLPGPTEPTPKTQIDKAKEEAASFRLYQLAADQGDPEHQFNLGFCYEHGIGVTQDMVQAANWYELAAVQGYAPAQCNLGACYSQGEGVEQDDIMAIDWYRLSAAQGNATALFNLAYCYQYGRGEIVDINEAVRLYQASAELGNEAAQLTLACLPVEIDRHQSSHLYDLVTQQESAIQPDTLPHTGAFASSASPITSKGVPEAKTDTKKSVRFKFEEPVEKEEMSANATSSFNLPSKPADRAALNPKQPDSAEEAVIVPPSSVTPGLFT